MYSENVTLQCILYFAFDVCINGCQPFACSRKGPIPEPPLVHVGLVCAWCKDPDMRLRFKVILLVKRSKPICMHRYHMYTQIPQYQIGILTTRVHMNYLFSVLPADDHHGHVRIREDSHGPRFLQLQPLP